MERPQKIAGKYRGKNTAEKIPRKKYRGKNTAEKIPRKKYRGKNTAEKIPRKTTPELNGNVIAFTVCYKG
jgi:hypothetical protein